MNLINLTPHAIVIRTPDGDTTIAPSGTIARVSATPGAVHDVAGFPCPVADPPVVGAVTGIPDAQDGVAYIVSGMVLSATDRADVFGPGTGPADGAVRNEDGHIIAVTRLIAARGRHAGGVLVGNV